MIQCVHGLLIRPGSWHYPSEFSLAISVRANAGNTFISQVCIGPLISLFNEHKWHEYKFWEEEKVMKPTNPSLLLSCVHRWRVLIGFAVKISKWYKPVRSSAFPLYSSRNYHLDTKVSDLYHARRLPVADRRCLGYRNAFFWDYQF